MSIKDALTQPTLRDEITLEVLNNPESHASLVAIERALSCAVQVAAEELSAIFIGDSQDQARVIASNLMTRGFIEHVVNKAQEG